MSKFEKGFHPSTLVEEREVPRVLMKLNLPSYVDRDRVGVNIRRIHTLMNLGRINSLSVTGARGETSQYTPTVVGAQPDGTVLPGIIGKVVKVDTYSTQHRDLHSAPEVSFAARWRDVSIQLNLNEITQRIEDRNKPQRDTGAWAREVNNAITSGLAREGSANVLGNLNRSEKMYAGGVYAVTQILSYLDAIVDETSIVEDLTVGYIIATAVLHAQQVLTTETRTGPEGINGYHGSIIYGPQIDSAIAINGLAHNRRVIKALR